MRLTVHHPTLNVPVLWWRSVGSTHTAFVMETLLDDIARATSQDPVAYRMRLFGDKHPRHRAALQLAVDKSGYGKTRVPAGRAWGVAVHASPSTPWWATWWKPRSRMVDQCSTGSRPALSFAKTPSGGPEVDLSIFPHGDGGRQDDLASTVRVLSVNACQPAPTRTNGARYNLQFPLGPVGVGLGARRTRHCPHNPKVAGSNPAPATSKDKGLRTATVAPWFFNPTFESKSPQKTGRPQRGYPPLHGQFTRGGVPNSFVAASGSCLSSFANKSGEKLGAQVPAGGLPGRGEVFTAVAGAGPAPSPGGRSISAIHDSSSL